MEITRKIRRGLIIAALAGLAILAMNGCAGDPVSGDMATITKQYKIAGTSDYSGITVWINGPQSVSSVTTTADGKIRINGGAGNYKLEASKTGFLPMKDTVVVTTLTTYDLGNEYLISSNPGAPPLMGSN